MNKRVTIGIPCFREMPPETEEDYMRLMYYLGRRCTDYDFFLGIKRKSEQFRARNSIVEAALQVGSDYLVMLDDDHVVDIDGASGPTNRYEFIRTLLGHLEKDEKKGIVGALYYKRGGDYAPVLMREHQGGFYFLNDSEITGGLQEVAVAGGGCLAINMKIFDKIESPWFQPENELGTDIQICKKAREAGYTVWADTSVELGHVMQTREVITSRNRSPRIAETQEGIDKAWQVTSAVRLYQQDVEEYLQKSQKEISELADTYDLKVFPRTDDAEVLREYYRTIGPSQLARQYMFHLQPPMIQQAEQIWSLFDRTAPGAHGIEYGCGSAPVGFELAMRGHHMTFIDVPGAAAYEFTKWRAQRRGVDRRCKWEIGGPYDFALFMDAIEHLAEWKEILSEVCSRIKEGGYLITNFFANNDYGNVEHITMNKREVESHLLSLGLYPQNPALWQKQSIVKESAA